MHTLHKPLLGCGLAVLLLTGCNKPADTAAPASASSAAADPASATAAAPATDEPTGEPAGTTDDGGKQATPEEAGVAFGGMMSAWSVYCGKTTKADVDKGMEQGKAKLAGTGKITAARFDQVFNAAYDQSMAKLKADPAAAKKQCEDLEKMEKMAKGLPQSQ